MRRSLCWLVLLGAMLTCGVLAADPPQDAAEEAINLQITEVRQIDAKTPEGEARLLELALDEHAPPTVRGMALDRIAIAKVTSPAVQQGVLSLVSKEVDETVRTAAIGSLHYVGVPADDAVPKLIAVLEDPRRPIVFKCPSPGSIDMAIMALENYGPEAREAVPALLWSINSKNRYQLQREGVEEALGRIAPDEFPHFAEGEAAIEQMIKLLSSSVPGERRFAAENLLALRYTPPFRGRDFIALSVGVIPALEENLDYPDRDVRLAAAAALLSRRADQPAAAIFDAAIDSGEDYDRQQIFEWLTRYHLHFDGTRLFYDYLKSHDLQVRIKAAARLGSSPREQEAFEVVRDLYVDNQYRTKALSALGAFRPELLEPLRPQLVKVAPERNTEGYFARNILEKKFGVVIEPKPQRSAKTPN